MKLDSWEARKTYSPESSTGCPALLRGVFRPNSGRSFCGYLQGCPDGAGSHHVDPDAFGGNLLGQGAAERDDGRFCGSIVHQVLAGLVGLNGGAGNDARPRLEMRKGFLGNPEQGEHVYFKCLG